MAYEELSQTWMKMGDLKAARLRFRLGGPMPLTWVISGPPYLGSSPLFISGAT
jgi:hypothetical protein